MENISEKQHDVHKNHDLKLIINNKHYEWAHQYIAGSQIRKLGKISEDEEIFLKISKPWHDELIKDDTEVDLARPGIEHFYSKPTIIKVIIYIDNKKYDITKGEHSVSEIKKLGGIPEAYELEQVINGTLTPLKDDSIICIEGEEKFFSHPRDGSSS